LIAKLILEYLAGEGLTHGDRELVNLDPSERNIPSQVTERNESGGREAARLITDMDWVVAQSLDQVQV